MFTLTLDELCLVQKQNFLRRKRIDTARFFDHSLSKDWEIQSFFSYFIKTHVLLDSCLITILAFREVMKYWWQIWMMKFDFRLKYVVVSSSGLIPRNWDRHGQSRVDLMIKQTAVTLYSVYYWAILCKFDLLKVIEKAPFYIWRCYFSS